MRAVHRFLIGVWVGIVALGLSGCASQSMFVSPPQRRPVDRAVVDYPAGHRLQTIIRNLSGPTSMAFDKDGSLIVVDRGTTDRAQIFGFKPDGTRFEIWPKPRTLPFSLGAERPGVYSPVSATVAADRKAYVLHRDRDGRGVISAIDYTGRSSTIVANLPCEAGHNLLDLVVSPYDGRLYFSVGSLTNSGVVGLDDWKQGWVDDHRGAYDRPASRYRLLGYRFDTRNPGGGWFSGSDIAVTAPFQPFGKSSQLWVNPPENGRPTAAIYSVDASGGDLRLEAHGIRRASGLAFNEFGRLYATNQGMELRGTRPVKDDPDVLLRIVRQTWYGWPDYSSDLRPITERQFQPPAEMIIKTGYPELSFLIDHQASGLITPDRETLLQTTLPSQSGAGRIAFVPGSGPLKAMSGSAIVALSGPPFSTTARKDAAIPGYRIIQVDVDNHRWRNLIHNATMGPGNGKHPDAIERPVDVKFGPDGALYILDMGQVEVEDGHLNAKARTGKIFRLDVPE